MDISYTGGACWATPDKYQRHAYLNFHFIDEHGELVKGPSAGEGSIQRDDLVDGWNNYKVKVDSQGYVSSYVNDNLVWDSKEKGKKLDLSKLDNCYLLLGTRSSGSVGKAYHVGRGRNKTMINLYYHGLSFFL